MYTQLVPPNLTIIGRLGYCLEYARKVFGAPAVEPTAWAGWEATQYKHEDSNLPTDVSVPLWFRYPANGTAPGHVAVNVPGIGIYSSPYNTPTGHAVLTSIPDIERKYGVSYVGWSEDISNVRVVKEGDTMTPTQRQTQAEDIVTELYLKSTGNYPTPDQASYWVPRVRDDPTGAKQLGNALPAYNANSAYEPITEQLFREKKK